MAAAGWRANLALGWQALLDSPGGPERVARGAAAGGFAAMLPVFGAHLVLAVLVAFPLRGSRVAAVAACLLIGNPLTHALILPVSYEIGRVVLPAPPAPRVDWLPGWLTAVLPVAEETLTGGLLLGAVVAPVVFLLVRAALRRRTRRRLR